MLWPQKPDTTPATLDSFYLHVHSCTHFRKALEAAERLTLPNIKLNRLQSTAPEEMVSMEADCPDMQGCESFPFHSFHLQNTAGITDIWVSEYETQRFNSELDSLML